MLFAPLLRDHLLRAGQAIAAAQGIGFTVASRLYARDSLFFRRIADGKPFGVETYDRVLCEIARAWPAGSVWPAEVPRPTSEEIVRTLGTAEPPVQIQRKRIRKTAPDRAAA